MAFQSNTGGTIACTFSNNIFYSPSSTAGYLVDVSTVASLVFTNNDHFGNGTWRWNSTGYSTFSAW